MRRIATAVLMLLMAGQHARAAENEPKVITLSCDGTVTETVVGLGASSDAKPQPMQKVGVVVNLNERTVSFGGFVARVTDVDAANIHFAGSLIRNTYPTSIVGDIDRVTGHMFARTEVSDLKPASESVEINSYEMLCKATDRVF